MELPMFPLGSVLFPTMILPLHVFEERYRALVDVCLAGDREFGVCLIERGNEVGGGEVRTDIACVAQIVDAQQFDDGRWALGAVGTRRLRIIDWLPDDPFPRAEVEDWIDPEPTEDLAVIRDEAVSHLRRVLALQAEVGDPAAPATTEVDDDPTLASYQIAALSPAGQFDRQQLLSAPSVAERFNLIGALLRDNETVLRARLDLA